MKDDQLKQEYQSFLAPEADVNVPRALEQRVQSHIAQDLNPSARRVLSKFAFLHLLSSVLTLSICPQFGLGPFFGQHGLMHYFMYFGDTICIALCGAFYLSSSVLLAFLLMKPEEWRRLRDLALPSFVGIAGLSLLSFFILTQSGWVKELFWSASFVLTWLIAAVTAAKSMERVLSIRS